jgi:hypothetical protein
LPIFDQLVSLGQQKPELTGRPIPGNPVATSEANADRVNRVPVVKVIRKVGNTFTPSIKNALGEQPSGDLVQKTIFADYPSTELESFTADQLTSKWNEFLETISDRPSLKSALSKVPEIGDNNLLTLVVGNSVQEESIRQIKPELVTWLRNELKNSTIELTTRFEKQEVGRTIFSDSEKLQMMLQKNPELLELRKKFNLDFTD